MTQKNSTWDIPFEIGTKHNLKDYGQIITADQIPHSLPIPFYKDTVTEGSNFPGIKFNGPVVVRQSQISPDRNKSDWHNVLWLERHQNMTQGFVGLGSSPFILVLGKPTPDHNKPDLSSVKAFIMKPGTGIFIHSGTWHDFPIAISPFTITCVVFNSKEVVDALSSMKEPSEMNFGDCQKLRLSKHFKYSKFRFNAIDAQQLCIQNCIKSIHTQYAHAIADNISELQIDNKYNYNYGNNIERKELLYILYPNEPKVAVIPVINVEVFLRGKGGPSIQPHLNSKPEVANSGWRDYGNRAGIKRLSRLFSELNVPATVVMNSDIVKYEKEVCDIIQSTKQWEIAAHGINNTDGFRDLPYDIEEREIRKCLGDIESAFGKKVTTWLTPGFSVTNNTTQILTKCGVKCILDFVNDDVPYLLQNKTDPKHSIVSIPYSLETNDISLCLTKGYNETQYAETLKNHILEMSENNIDGKMNVVCLGMHTFIAGVPSRIRSLRKVLKELKSNNSLWFASANEVLHYVSTKSTNCQYMTAKL